MNVDFIEFPVLETQRLVLRKIEERDFESVHRLHSDPVVNAFVGRDNASTPEKAKAYIAKVQGVMDQNACFCWTITLKGNDHLVGIVSIWNYDIPNEIVEVGYEMLPEFQQKGIMTESLKQVISYSFDKVKAKMITAFPSADNVSSVAVLKKLNFKRENKPYNNAHDIEGLVTYTLRNENGDYVTE